LLVVDRTLQFSAPIPEIPTLVRWDGRVARPAEQVAMILW